MYTVNNNDFADEKGTAATDQRHKLILVGIVSPTFSHSTSWFARTVVNGWQLSFISNSLPCSPSTPPSAAYPPQRYLPSRTSLATSTVNGLGGSTRVPFLPVDNLNVGPTFGTNARIEKTFSIRERFKLLLGFEATNVFNHLIIEGASPLQEQEYTLTKSGSQSVLVPYPLYKQVLQTQAPPDGTTARRAQASLRIIF